MEKFSVKKPFTILVAVIMVLLLGFVSITSLQTNLLPEMLRRQGETLTEELEYAIRRMGAMLEPALILCVGILVAVILIAMYMPMFSLGGIMG